MKPVDRIIECDLQIQDVEVMILEDNVRDVRRQLVHAFSQNEKLVTALSEAREQMGLLKEEVDRLSAPPSTYGIYLSANDDGTVNVLFQGSKPTANLHPSTKPPDATPAQHPLLN